MEYLEKIKNSGQREESETMRGEGQ